MKYWINIHCIKILNDRCPLSLRRDREKVSQKLQSLQNISSLQLQKTVQSETSDREKAKLFVRRNVYMCTNASGRRFSFARICPSRNFSLQPRIFNIFSRLAEESSHKIYSIPLKQLEEVHVADESILYNLFAALSDKQVFPCLLRVTQREMILSHLKYISHVCAVGFLPSNTNRLNVRQTEATITRSYGPRYSNMSPLKAS